MNDWMTILDLYLSAHPVWAARVVGNGGDELGATVEQPRVRYCTLCEEEHIFDKEGHIYDILLPIDYGDRQFVMKRGEFTHTWRMV